MDDTQRVDFDTARALMLMGFPQHDSVPGKPKLRPVRLGQPHYVTIYSSNIIRKYVEELTIGSAKAADVMCYVPTKKEACEWLLQQIEK